MTGDLQEVYLKKHPSSDCFSVYLLRRQLTSSNRKSAEVNTYIDTHMLTISLPEIHFETIFISQREREKKKTPFVSASPCKEPTLYNKQEQIRALRAGYQQYAGWFRKRATLEASQH